MGASTSLMVFRHAPQTFPPHTSSEYLTSKHWLNGATSQIRTGDITLTKRAFYLLKYSSISKYSRRGSLVMTSQHFSLDCTFGSCAPSPISFSAYAGFYCSPVNTLIWGGLTPLPETPPCQVELAAHRGFEPLTSCVTGKHSDQLN